jgi:hypothetical protein
MSWAEGRCVRVITSACRCSALRNHAMLLQTLSYHSVLEQPRPRCIGSILAGIVAILCTTCRGRSSKRARDCRCWPTTPVGSKISGSHRCSYTCVQLQSCLRGFASIVTGLASDFVWFRAAPHRCVQEPLGQWIRIAYVWRRAHHNAMHSCCTIGRCIRESSPILSVVAEPRSYLREQGGIMGPHGGTC